MTLQFCITAHCEGEYQEVMGSRSHEVTKSKGIEIGRKDNR